MYSGVKFFLGGFISGIPHVRWFVTPPPKPVTLGFPPIDLTPETMYVSFLLPSGIEKRINGRVAVKSGPSCNFSIASCGGRLSKERGYQFGFIISGEDDAVKISG